jgi:hypothetical protein
MASSASSPVPAAEGTRLPAGRPLSIHARLRPHALGAQRLVPYTKSDQDRIILMTAGTEAALRVHRTGQITACEIAGDRWEKRPELAHLVFA